MPPRRQVARPWNGKRCRVMSDRTMALIGRLWADRRGVTAIVTAFAMLALMGVAGLGVDVVYWELTGRKMQSAADAAALAASVAVAAGDNSTNAADAVTASYGFVNGQNGVSVSVNPNSGSSGGDVQVNVSQPAPLYFTRLFLASAPTVAATSLAKP